MPDIDRVPVLALAEKKDYNRIQAACVEDHFRIKLDHSPSTKSMRDIPALLGIIVDLPTHAQGGLPRLVEAVTTLAPSRPLRSSRRVQYSSSPVSSRRRTKRDASSKGKKVVESSKRNKSLFSEGPRQEKVINISTTSEDEALAWAFEASWLEMRHWFGEGSSFQPVGEGFFFLRDPRGTSSEEGRSPASEPVDK